MNKLSAITLSLVCLVMAALAVSKGYALFTDIVVARDNAFYSGAFDIQMSTTDVDSDNIAEGTAVNWTDSKVGVWTSPLQWTPGKILSSRVFIRNRGNIDAEKVLMTFANRTFFGAQQLDQVINLIDAWYDRNANGIEDPGDDISGALDLAYNTNGGSLTLKELFDGTNVENGGMAFDLEAGAALLEGADTNPVIGGGSGRGKGLFMIWQFDPGAGVEYQDAWVKLDFVFTGEQKTS